MTYKELVDRFALAVSDHKMIADFGYGQFSDIKVLDEDGDGADYPYAFLLPTGASRANNAMTYNFALIMMEMALNPSEILKVQSDCIQYVNDIVAELRFDDTFTGDLLLTQSVEVFRERFQDEVAGATANIQVTVLDTINDCIAPTPELLKLVEVQNSFDYNRDPDTSGDNPLQFNVDIVNDGNWQNTNYYQINADITATYRFEWTQQVKFRVPVGSEIIPEAPAIVENRSGVVNAPTQISGWPTLVTDPNRVYNISAIYEFTPVDTVFGDEWSLVILLDDPTEQEVRVDFLANGTLKIFKQV